MEEAIQHKDSSGKALGGLRRQLHARRQRAGLRAAAQEKKQRDSKEGGGL